MKRFAITLLLTALAIVARAAFSGGYNMAYLNLGTGLTSNFVDDIFQDSYGFVWLSTHNGGLLRYDGYSFINFGLSNDGIRLRSKASRNVCEDTHKRLWAAFEEGFQVIDLNTLQPTDVRCANEHLTAAYNKIYNKSCVRTYCDTKGAVWLVMQTLVCRFTFDDDGTITDIAQMPFSFPASFLDVAISDVSGDGTVLMSCNGRICTIKEQRGKLTAQPLPDAPEAVNGRVVTSILSYNGAIWFATTTGLFNNRKNFNVYHYGAGETSLQHDFVASLAIAPDGRLLIGTLNGVDILDDKMQAMAHWNSESYINPLSSNFVNCIYVKDGLVWVGTENCGVVKLSPRQLNVTNYVHHDATGSLSPNCVNAMYAEPDGTLWVGTVEGGLNRMAQGAESFAHYTSANSALPHNSVSALEADGNGHLWVGTWGGGLASLDMRKTGILQRLATSGDYTNQLKFIGALAYDKLNNGLWIGANEGLFYYNMNTRELEKPFHDCTRLKGYIGSIITSDGKLYMGNLGGMVEVDLRSRKRPHGSFEYKTYRYKLDNPESGVYDKLTAFCEAKDGTLWIGSAAYGLYHATKGKDGKMAFRCYTTHHGLASDFVKGIVEDDEGMLWIATDNGLSLFNPRTGVFNNFGETDGLVSSQFYYNGAIKTKAGRLYFGTVKGLVAIDGVTSYYRDAKMGSGSLRLTRLMINNQYVYAGSNNLDTDISQAKKITLHESDRSFTIEFSALNYGSETQGVYSYRMEGFDKEWTQLPPGQHGVRYSMLPAGNYQFEVRYLPSVGANDAQTVSVNVVVKPYFYKSWWFILVMLLAMAAIATYLYKRRLRVIREREAEKLYAPIAAALKESDEPGILQSRIQGILKNHAMYKESQDKSVQTDNEQVVGTAKPFMERVIGILEEHYSDADFGVAELVDKMGMNRNALSKRLNEETGTTTQQYIRNYRLEIAKKMLDNNVANRNITEIAYRVGFNDPKYFTRCFTKLFGVSPSSYKETK